MGSTTSEHHIVMLPFMAQGHLIPFLALANKIHQKFGFKITIATTPLNVKYLIKTTSKTPTTQIHFHELPFNSCDHNLPPNTENTEALPPHQIANLFQASTSLEPNFRKFISDTSIEGGRPPLCIISDIFMAWANQVAKDYNTVNVPFSTGGAYGTAAYVSLWQNLPHLSTNNDEFCVPGFPDSCIFNITQLDPLLRDADGTDPWSSFVQPQIRHSMESFGLLCHTVEEIEPLGLDVLRKYAKLPIWCIGPLLPETMLSEKSSRKTIGSHTGREPGVSPENCIEWLDCHPEASVLYISFGSQNTISPSQMMALAMGLEDTNKAFIWVIRPPVGFNLRGEFKPEWLPEGFEERMASKRQGLVVHGWAPQLEILCHKSTGAFLSHCGWNSIMECLSQGVPMIGWPLAAEQEYNSKMLVEEMGVCVELTRGVQSSLSKEKVKQVIEMAMEKKEGNKADDMKKKAGEIGDSIRASVREGGSHSSQMGEFVHALLSKIQGAV